MSDDAKGEVAPVGFGRDDRPVRVLIVEDNEGFVYFLRDVLTRQHVAQFKVATAGRLDDALAVLDEQATDVILLDLGLPDSAGFRTFHHVHATDPRIPIIILTVLDDDETAVSTMRAGAQDYLVKNEVDRNLLVRSIRYAVERAKVDEDLRQLSARLIQLQDEERRRIARELHDMSAQNLAALALNLSVLKNQLLTDAPQATRDLVSDCVSFVETCSSELRTMSYLLHPPLLDALGLGGAIRDYADGFAKRSGIRVDLELPSDLGRMPSEAETTVFRVMQECLTNVLRHSGSHTASISLYHEGNDLFLEISDTGHGMPAEQLQDMREGRSGLGVGIAGMRERLRQLDGRLTIDSSESGTCIRSRLPYREAEGP